MVDCSGNTLACRKYHERKKDKVEYKLRKQAYSQRRYYKKRHSWFYKIFQAWKSLSAKPITSEMWCVKKSLLTKNDQVKPNDITTVYFF